MCCTPDVLLLVLVFSPISHVTAHHFEEASDKLMGIRGYHQRAMVNSKTSQSKTFLHDQHILFPSSHEFLPPWNVQVTLQHIENTDWKALLKACNRLPSHKAVPRSSPPSRGRPGKYFISPAGGASDNSSKCNSIGRL